MGKLEKQYTTVSAPDSRFLLTETDLDGNNLVFLPAFRCVVNSTLERTFLSMN